MKPNVKRFLTIGGVALGASALTLLAVRARAAGIPEADGMTYTGYLEDAEGAPLTGAHSIAVQFWASEEAEDDLCAGSLASVELQSGRFQVPLPVSCSEAVSASPDIWVSVSVDGAPLARTKLGSVPFALEAGHAISADQAAHAAVAADADGALDGRIADIEAAMPGDSGFRVPTNAAGVSIPHGSPRSLLLWGTEEFDFGDEFDTTTDTFTPTDGGYYQVNCTLFYETGAGQYFMETGIVVNEKLVDAANLLNDGTTHQPVRANALIKLNPGDKLQCGAWQSSGGTLNIRSRNTFPNEAPSAFSAFRVRPL